MTVEEFQKLLEPVIDTAAAHPLDDRLASTLNLRFPPDGEAFQAIERACHEAIKAGWMCKHEAGGIRFGRVVKPGPATRGFSVDVVDMRDVKGPHHRHPKGEIDMIMPVSGAARFDGHAAGWCVYPPDSAHHPTVSEGQALVLYLLPDGEIEFTNQ
ncbi:MAG: DUF4863 family protein [Gammaproteobacteria bacterium]|nr:DUF4863 family protein [Gammaproteobacteria bacterium]NIR84769.1 DUF4863 family protein [Gammaproteobacteria bacterium]NIR91265.1 DUF4863 family protein [Gammaproteobacteria bacterium]NIU05812.1 DUF4863 family protein [Gammaproteobacteria bacterium]NIV52931.1 DUF4863 family protein [Gammaproteobacteria bacterium]